MATDIHVQVYTAGIQCIYSRTGTNHERKTFWLSDKQNGTVERVRLAKGLENKTDQENTVLKDMVGKLSCFGW